MDEFSPGFLSFRPFSCKIKWILSVLGLSPVGFCVDGQRKKMPWVRKIHGEGLDCGANGDFIFDEVKFERWELSDRWIRIDGRHGLNFR